MIEADVDVKATVDALIDDQSRCRRIEESVAVVPANAGTHTPRPSLSFSMAITFIHYQSRWLWVPAFAGTTSG